MKYLRINGYFINLAVITDFGVGCCSIMHHNNKEYFSLVIILDNNENVYILPMKNLLTTQRDAETASAKLQDVIYKILRDDTVAVDDLMLHGYWAGNLEDVKDMCMKHEKIQQCNEDDD